MDIPHIDAIREHRETLAAAEGVGPHLQRIQSVLLQLGLCRNQPAEALPGEELLAELAARPGLEGLPAVDKPADAPWPARVAARELALRSADAVLRPLFDEAHRAQHAIEDLRKAQFEALSDEPELRAELQALVDEAARARAEVAPIAQRRHMLEPTESVLATYTEKLGRALESTAPIRDALAEAFATSAREGMDRMLAELGLDETLPDGPPEEVYTALEAWAERIRELADKLDAELEQAQTAAREAQAAVEARLG